MAEILHNRTHHRERSFLFYLKKRINHRQILAVAAWTQILFCFQFHLIKCFKFQESIGRDIVLFHRSSRLKVTFSVQSRTTEQKIFIFRCIHWKLAKETFFIPFINPFRYTCNFRRRSEFHIRRQMKCMEKLKV